MLQYRKKIAYFLLLGSQMRTNIELNNKLSMELASNKLSTSNMSSKNRNKSQPSTFLLINILMLVLIIILFFH